MGLFDRIFSKNEKVQSAGEIPTDFEILVEKSIGLIGTSEDGLDNEGLHQHLIKNGIPEQEAEEIIIFLPVAFCKKLLPELNWQPNYIEYYSKRNQVKKKYSENGRFIIIEKITEEYWGNNPNRDIVMRVAGWSAEFNAINQLLNDGGKLEDVVLTESYVIRNK